MPDIAVYFSHPGQPATSTDQGVVVAHTDDDINWYFVSWAANVHFARIA
jgi:hypothetical protein